MVMINETFVKAKLKELGNSMLKKPYKDMWTEDNPTLGYCYIVSEALYHYLDGDIKSYCISMGDGFTHWYIVRDGEILDFTKEQFIGLGMNIDYNRSVHKKFYKGSFETKKGFISKRGFEMAKLLNLIEE